MFSWSRTWYAKRDGKYFNFEMKRQRDEACREYGFEKVSAKEAYDHYPYIQIEWRKYENFIRSYCYENKVD